MAKRIQIGDGKMEKEEESKNKKSKKIEPKLNQFEEKRDVIEPNEKKIEKKEQELKQFEGEDVSSTLAALDAIFTRLDELGKKITGVKDLMPIGNLTKESVHSYLALIEFIQKCAPKIDLYFNDKPIFS